MPIFLILLAGAVAYAATRKKAPSGGGGTYTTPGGGTVSTTGTFPGFPGCPPAGTLDGGVASLPAPYNTLVNAAMIAEPPFASSASLMVLSQNLAACGQKKAAIEVAARASILKARGA